VQTTRALEDERNSCTHTGQGEYVMVAREAPKDETKGELMAQAGRTVLFLTVKAMAATVAVLLLCSACLAQAAESPAYLFSFGPDGTAESNFERAGSIAVDQQTDDVYVIDTAKGSLYKFDADGEAVAYGGTSPYINGNEITGLSFHGGSGESQIAVDSQSHVVYVTSNNAVRAFQANGEPVEFTAGPAAGTSEIGGFAELIGVAVDVNGAVYASDYGPGGSGTISVFAPSGELITQFNTSKPSNIAVGSDGSVYVVEYFGDVYKFTPSEFPVTSATTYLTGAPFSEDLAFGIGIDPVTGDVYLVEPDPSSPEASRVAHYDSSGTFLGYFGGAGEEGTLGNLSFGIGVNGNTGKVYVGDAAAGGPSQVEVFGAEEIFVGAPTIVSTAVSSVSADAATLHARINPNTLETTYYFEYGTESCAQIPNPCAVVPVGGGEVGSGHEPLPVSLTIDGLSSGVIYHFRVIAKNSLGTTIGPDRTFTTQGTALGPPLSDGRVWEMVSPPDKSAALLRGAEDGLVQAAADGNGLVYSSLRSIEPMPDGNRAVEKSAVLARRGVNGWASKDITAPHARTTPIASGGEYKLFTPDLSKTVLEPRDGMPLSPAASERTPYLRENSQPPLYTPLVTSKEGSANVPAGTQFGGDEIHGYRSAVFFAGANPDLSHIVLKSDVPLVEGASPHALYEWVSGNLRPVSVLPEDEGGSWVQAILGTDQGSVRHAVSEDGSRVFWSTGFYSAAGIGTTGLYLRDTDVGRTIRLDVAQSGASGAGEPHPAFQGASADGSVVFFTDSRQLTADASSEGRDLYRCQLSSVSTSLGCVSLVNLTAPSGGSGASAEVEGLVPAFSEDGTIAYFVAKGILAESPNQHGEVAAAGKHNLYLWQEGSGVRFIATLADGDETAWGQTAGLPGYAGLLSAAGSPSGRYFSFMSERSLTGYENADADSGESAQEVFRYDAASDRLDCVSCNPSGANPEAEVVQGSSISDPRRLWQGQWVAAILPEAAVTAGDAFLYPVYRPRAVLDNGRMFFNAIDSLVPADSNDEWDVYQFEPLGVGSCTASAGSASSANAANGCVGLISSGAAGEESAFLDASPSGNDIFFLSPDQLSPLDNDEVRDVYDARVGGAPGMPASNPDCQGETCQPRGAAPSQATPMTMTFRGAGNLRPKRCPKSKRKVRRGGKTRCVRRHKRHTHKHRGHHRTEVPR